MSSTLGRKLRRWTYSEIMRLHALHHQNKTRAEIAAELQMPESRIRERLQWEAQAGTLKIARKRRRREQQKVEQRSPRIHLEMVCTGPKPTDQALADRAMRCAALPRDLTGILMGDPPSGFSALERRV